MRPKYFENKQNGPYILVHFSLKSQTLKNPGAFFNILEWNFEIQRKYGFRDYDRFFPARSAVFSYFRQSQKK